MSAASVHSQGEVRGFFFLQDLLALIYIDCDAGHCERRDLIPKVLLIGIPTAIQRRQWHPLQYSCRANPMDRGAWWAAVHGAAKSQAQLSDFTFTFHFQALEREMPTHSCSCLENPRDGGAW